MSLYLSNYVDLELSKPSILSNGTNLDARLLKPLPLSPLFVHCPWGRPFSCPLREPNSLLAKREPSLFSLADTPTPPRIGSLSWRGHGREIPLVRFWFRVLSLVRGLARMRLRSPALGDFRALACLLPDRGLGRTPPLLLPLLFYLGISISLSLVFGAWLFCLLVLICAHVLSFALFLHCFSDL